MEKKNIYHLVAIILAILAIVLAVVLLIWGEKGSIFIVIALLLLAKFIDNIGQKNG